MMKPKDWAQLFHNVTYDDGLSEESFQVSKMMAFPNFRRTISV